MMNKNQFVAVLFAGLVLVSGVAPVSGVGTVAGQSTNDSCEISPVTGKEVCLRAYGTIDGATVEEIWLSMHVQSESMHDRYERYTVEKASISNLTTGMQTEEGTVTFIQAYNDGASVAEAKAEAYKSVNDMSSGWQASIAYEQTAQAEMVRVMREEANGTDGLSVNDVFVGASGSNNHLEVVDGNLTLYNGTEINVTRVGIIDTYWHNNDAKTDKVYTYYDGDWQELNETIGERDFQDRDVYLSALNVRGPESVNGSTVHAMDAQRAKWTLDIIDDNRKVAIDNVGAFGDSFAANYDRGEVSAEEFMSPAYRMRTQSTNYQTTGHYAYLLLAAQDRGMAVDIDTGFTVTINQSGPMPEKTIDGGLYATSGTFSAYNGTIQSGVQYDANELNGTVWVIDSGTSQQYTLNGTFVVDEMRDIGNNSTVINQTSLQDTSFATRDADGFKEDVQDWNKTYQTVINNTTYIYPGAQTPDDNDGSGVAFGGSTTRLVLVTVILLGGAALLSGRKDDYR